MNETIPYLPGLSPVGGKALCARFDGGRLSSDGGVLSFAGIERRLGICDLLASRVTDERDPASTTHSYADMIRQVTRNVKRWRHAEMALGWTAAGPLEAQKTFRRLSGTVCHRRLHRQDEVFQFNWVMHRMGTDGQLTI